MYLLYGSDDVTSGNVDWLLLHSIENANGDINGQLRVGSLSSLGTAGQNNPILGAPGYSFNGITFQTASNPNSQLGASVAAIPGGIAGQPAFLVGAPNAFALNDTTGTTPRYGRAYLIFGNGLAKAQPMINLDAASGSQGATYITFGANIPARTNATNLIGVAGSIGRSVAAVPNFFNDNGVALAFGAPTATFSGVNSGAVYVVAQSAYAGAASVNLATVGQANGLRGVIFGSTVAGAFTGVSVANAGNVNKRGTINDLLIGAPGTLNPFTQAPAANYAGNAFLIYGNNNLFSFSTVNANSINSISLSQIGDPVVTTGAVAGADFVGALADATGYALSPGGDVNNDGFADFLIGSPLANGGDGSATLIYGQADLLNSAANGTSNPILGTIPIDTFPLTEVPSKTGATGASSAITGTPPPIVGADFSTLSSISPDAGGDFVGFSVGLSGAIPTGSKFSDILIGAPGFTDPVTALANQGEVFVVPGASNFYGGDQPLDFRVGLQLQYSATPGQTASAYFGASVDGALVKSTQSKTADGDLQADFIIGAPGSSGFGATSGVARSGAAYVVEGNNTNTAVFTSMDSIGGSLPIFLPQITGQFGIGSLRTPFPAVSATAPTLTFFIYSQKSVNGIAGNNFDPFLGIDQSEPIVVNGIPMPATIVSVPDANNDGIPEAAVTVTGIPLLGLVNGLNALTISWGHLPE